MRVGTKKLVSMKGGAAASHHWIAYIVQNYCNSSVPYTNYRNSNYVNYINSEIFVLSKNLAK